MRKIANFPANGEYVRAMIYESTEGVYLFLYDTLEDAPCVADELYETVAESEAACGRRYGVSVTDWAVIENPQAGCQHDWIRSTRIKVDAQGRKMRGQFEPVK